MSFDYIRRTYGVPAKRGGRVEVMMPYNTPFLGTITRATHYLFVRLDGDTRATAYHPTDPAITYLPASEGRADG